MEEIINIIKNLSSIIIESDKDLSELSKKTGYYMSLPHLKPYLNFFHKGHDGESIKLRFCNAYHCLLCLEIDVLESGTCSHGFPLTIFEKYQVQVLIEDYLEHKSEDNSLYKKCNICRNRFMHEETEDRDCRCQICDYCFFTEYRQRKVSCKICSKKISHAVAKDIARKLGENIDVFDYCSKCKLAYELGCVNDDICFLCEQENRIQ